ncbi:hypothetical protein C7382_1198 [Porphyromonas loveana]|uniref:Uncharacterized protein n=2 Tax=Porphyromonadaceae TaxID=171551 RepID=A0A2U1F4C4_9PORP|nr:hypothetical protein C7382_1198 [Porphyromonas loveana]
MGIKHIFSTLTDGLGGINKTKKMDFNDLNWHDAVIKNISIDRSNPGKRDIIQLDIIWTNGIKSTITFSNVYFASFEMNFGIVALDSIFKAYSEDRNSYLVKELYKKWKGLIDDVDLNYYEIETNSTKSTIVIIAQEFKIDDNL